MFVPALHLDICSFQCTRKSLSGRSDNSCTPPAFLLHPPPPSSPSCPVFDSHWSVFERLPLTGESAVGSLLIIQPQRGRVTEGDALIVIGQLWTPAPPTCKRGQRSNKSSQAQRGGNGYRQVWRSKVGHAGKDEAGKHGVEGIVHDNGRRFCSRTSETPLRRF